jgi:hypothetical protein
MAHLTGVSIATSVNANTITDESTAGGPTVEDSLTALNAAKAPKANATLTGTTTVATLAVGTAATVPTVSVGDTDTSAASTAFVMQAVGLVVQVAEDAAAAILNTTGVLYLASTTTGTKVITQTSTRANQRLEIVLAAGTGGEYNLAEASGVPGGALTFIDTGDRATLYRNAANDGWLVALDGATIV